jgi:hypothetical protein
MFSAYLDESGKGGERKSFIAVGGLVSSALQWERFQVEWTDQLRRVPDMPLDEQNRPVPFHMNKFESGHWPERGYRWRSEKTKTRFLSDLLDIIRRRVKLRVFTAVQLGDYHQLFPKDEKFKHPWVLCAIGCASCISKWAEREGHDAVPFIFEKGGEGWGIAMDNHRDLEKRGRRRKTKIGSWTTDDRHVAGLQAADLWAWELRHHFQAQLSDRPYSLRASLKKMLGVPDGSGFVLRAVDLNVLVEDLRLGTSTIQPVTFCRKGILKINTEAL